MRLLLLADVHGNWPALQAVVAAEKYDLCLCLGDLVDWTIEVQEPGVPLSPPPAEGRLELPPLDRVQMCARGLDAEIAFHGPASVVGLLWAAIRSCTPPDTPSWHGLATVLLHARDEWQRQPRHRDPIFERDGWRCAVPACSSRASLHDHHVILML